MSDSSQGPGWWQAADGKWYPPDEPPGPGWWKASDGNWYPPQDTATPTEAVPTAPVEAAAGAPQAPAEAAPTAPVDATPGAPAPVAPGAPAPAAPAAPAAPVAVAKRSNKGVLVGLGVLVVILLIAGVAIVLTRGGSDTAVTSGSGDKATTTTAAGGGGSGGGGGGGGSGDKGGGGGGGGGGPADISDEMPSDDITLADDVKVVDSEAGAKVKGFSDDGTAILVDKSAKGIDELKEGDVLLLSGITVVRVAGLDEIDEGVVVTGEPVTLPEVIAEGDLEWSDVAYDPNKMRLRVWDDGSGGGGSSGGGGGGGSSGPSDEQIIEEGGEQIIEGLEGASVTPGAGPVIATPVVAQVDGRPTTFALPGRTVSGKVADFAFDLSYEPEGSGSHIVLNLDSSGDLDGTIKVDVHLGALATSGSAKVNGRQLRNFDFSFAELGGEATITTNLRSTKQLTSVMTPPFLKVPFSIEFPALVGGVPFTLSLSGTIQVQLSMALANATLGGEAKISFGGDAGMRFDGGSLSVNGKRQQDAEDLVKTVQGLANGPVGVVVTAELPKVGFGFGFLQTGAGVYLSSGMVVQQSILPPPPACTGLQIAYVLAAGVEAKFLGKEFDIGRKAVVDKRWDYTVPKTKQCMPEMR